MGGSGDVILEHAAFWDGGLDGGVREERSLGGLVGMSSPSGFTPPPIINSSFIQLFALSRKKGQRAGWIVSFILQLFEIKGHFL